MVTAKRGQCALHKLHSDSMSEEDISMKSYISRRNFLKAAGAMTGAAAALGLTAAPVSADGLFYPLIAPDKHPITIL